MTGWHPLSNVPLLVEATCADVLKDTPLTPGAAAVGSEMFTRSCGFSPTHGGSCLSHTYRMYHTAGMELRHGPKPYRSWCGRGGCEPGWHIPGVQRLRTHGPQDLLRSLAHLSL
jgi:hypothetical protein